jgi:spermidine/putrescine transport system permease protein
MKRLSTVFARELSFMLSLPAVIWQFLFMAAPAAIIIYFSMASTGAWPITLHHYYQHFQLTSIKIIGRSLLFAITTASTCLFLAYPVSYYLAFHVRKFRNILLFLLTLPFWVNFLVQVYAWYFLLEYKGLINTTLLKLGIIHEPLMLSNTLFAIYLVMVYCYLPFMIMPLYSTLEKIDKRLLEASADLGATQWQTFYRITMPLSLSGIKTGFLLVLIPAFGEFVIPSLLGGSKYMFVGSLISYYFLVARDNTSGAAVTCLSGFVLIMAILVIYSMHRFWILFGLRRQGI